jgi:hypothetical protein
MKIILFIKISILLMIALQSLPAEEGFKLLATMSGDSIGDGFSIVAGMGDVNEDGYDDVLVGAPGGNYAKLYFGGADFDTVADLTFRDKKEQTRFGCALAGRGDINGDGCPDIVIGAEFNWVGPSWPLECIWDAGAVYVYFGGANLDTTADLELVIGSWESGTGWYYNFGHALDYAGDVNNDGYDDLIVSAPNDDFDAHGRVYIYLGGPNVDDKYDVLMEGQDHFDKFGWSVSSVGDVNKDGFDDVVIGAPQSLADDEPGKAYLVYGGKEINLAYSEVFVGDSTMHNYGNTVSGLGDVNGDEYTDFGIMAFDCFRIYSGKVYDTLLTILSDTSSFETFYALTEFEDIDVDGFCDFSLSIQKVINNEIYNQLLFYKGNDSLNLIADYKISEHANGYFESMSYLGDIDKDSKNEVIIGNWLAETENGKVFIYSYGKIENIINKNPNLNNRYSLFQNYPNPFNPNTAITYFLPVNSKVEMDIYNIAGQKVTTLISAWQTAGNHKIKWNGQDKNGMNVSSGIYLYQLKANGFQQCKKMILIR